MIYGQRWTFRHFAKILIHKRPNLDEPEKKNAVRSVYSLPRPGGEGGAQRRMRWEREAWFT